SAAALTLTTYGICPYRKPDLSKPKFNKKSYQTKSKMPEELSGIVKRHQDGFGFFVPDDPDHPDVYIPRHSMDFVMTTDRVKVRAYRQSDGRYNGEIVEVIERGLKEVLGQFHSRPDGTGRIYDAEST